VAFRPRDVVAGVRAGILDTTRRVAVPACLSATSWAIGILMYNLIVGRSGTQQLAALSMISPIESAAAAAFVGVSTAAAVLVANGLGSGDTGGSWRLSQALLIWTAGLALVTCAALFSARFWMPWLYRGIDAETMVVARNAAIVLSAVFLFRAMNIILMNGLLRSGGDTVFILKVDVFTQWVISIPLTALVALEWRLAFPIVFLAINSEEIVKFFVSGRRVMRRQWIRSLVG
jgi:Na+-driven multidrug efflux pump